MCGAPGTTTGASTPHSSLSLCPLAHNGGPPQHHLLIPTTLPYYSTELCPRFAPRLPPPADEYALGEEPSSVPELLSWLLDLVTYLVTDGEDDAQGTYEDVLRLVLTGFEGCFGGPTRFMLWLLNCPPLRPRC
ncbi:hypothetical protein HOY80DRAFT_492093 [Tuber brumale]|nr:hypothetical protein HOY80DRAFT_492093 [Tuber brumale]